MKINELLTESQTQLDEGPLGSLGKAVGKGVGAAAKGIGAVAGGIAGIPGAVKKGFQAGKKTVGGDDSAAEPAQAAAPAAPAAGADQGDGVIQQFKKGFAQGRGAAPADQSTSPAAAPAAAPAAGTQTQPAAQSGEQPAAAPAAQPAAAPATATQAAPATGAQAQPAAKTATPYKAAQDAVAKLDKRGKQNLLKLLQKEFPQAAPAAQPAAAPAQPAAAPAAPAAEPAVQQAAPAAQTAPAADPAPAKKPRARKKAAAPSQAEIDADRARIMGVTSDSVIRTGNKLEETLAARVEQHKRRMFEQSLIKGEVSIFTK